MLVSIVVLCILIPGFLEAFILGGMGIGSALILFTMSLPMKFGIENMHYLLDVEKKKKEAEENKEGLQQQLQQKKAEPFQSKQEDLLRLQENLAAATYFLEILEYIQK